MRLRFSAGEKIDRQRLEPLEESPPENPIEAVLSSREKEFDRPLGGGVNITTYVKLRDNGADVFKPKNGENKSYHESGSFFKRERASYLVDKFLNFNLVPPTVIREINEQIGSVQEFIPDADTFNQITRREEETATRNNELLKLWLFDMLIYNADRHCGNLLYKEEKIFAIDNGISFSGKSHLHVTKTFENKNIPENIKRQFNEFKKNTKKKETLEKLLLELLDKEEVDAFFARLDKIAEFLQKAFISSENYKKFSYHPK